MNPDAPFTPALWHQIQTNRAVRLKLATENLYAFAHIYFPEAVRNPTAEFQKEMYKLLADDTIDYLAIVAFRNSGKSTIVTQIYAIWALLGVLNKKYILIVSLNQNQAQGHLQNIKRQIESNELLRKDFGPLEERSDEWGSMSLVFPNIGARISAVSMGQSVRGTRHGSFRPDLIICDDIEDTETTKTREGRNKIYNWYVSEILPLGDPGTKIVLVGNLLHEDSLMMRVKAGIEDDEIDGLFRMYPLVDESGRCLWPGKYPDAASIERARRKINDRIAWHREYLLRILPTDEQVIHNDWIKYYDKIPELKFEHEEPRLRYKATYVGIDPAITQRDAGDCTAMVAVRVFGNEESLRVYVYPKIINKHLTGQETIDTAGDMVQALGDKHSVKLVVEDVAYQAMLAHLLENKNYRVTRFKVGNADKRSRLISVSHLFETGKVFFPKDYAKDLIAQVVGFGIEKHDDLMDALVMALTEAVKADKAYVAPTTISVGKTFEEMYQDAGGDYGDFGGFY
jgi:predicted phage terminase large subunit-like protein